MRRTLAIAAVVGLILTLAPEVQADHRWDAFGPRFVIGGIPFVLAFGQPGFAAPRGYYYRVARPLSYRGHRCSSACLHDRSESYHHERCPLVRTHFHRYGVDPYDVFARYAPRRGYDDYGYHGRYDDRYRDDRHRDDRYRDDRYRDDRYRDRYYDDRYYDDRYYDDRHYDRGGRYDRHRGRGNGHRRHRHGRGCGHY